MSPAEREFEAERLEIIAALEQSHFWFVARRALVERLLKRSWPSPVSLIVDVGCGTGALAVALSKRDTAVLALDLRPEGLRRVRHAGGPIRVAIARSERLPVASAVADAALALDVLEHADDVTSLGEIARVLKPGGVVVITVPALPWLWSARDDEAGHRRRYTRRSLLSLVRGAGLEPLDVRFYQCLLLPVLIATRAAGRLWSTTQRIEERPLGWINRLCLAISRFEVAMGDYVPWPAGSSLAAVARKPA